MKIIELNKYIKWLKERNYSLRTIELYTQALKKFAKPIINTENIRSFLTKSLNYCEANTVKIYQRALSSYSKFQKLTIDWSLITRIIPKVTPKLFTIINHQELEKLKKTKTERFDENYQRNNLILDFLFYTGVRVSELVNVKHSDYQQKLLRILGKGNKVRYILIPEFFNFFKPSKRSYLFTNLNGKKMLVKQIQRVIRNRAIKAQLGKNITPHTFRRSFATLLNNSGTNLTTIQKLLGHSDINTTASYIHNSYEAIYADYSKLWTKN